MPLFEAHGVHTFEDFLRRDQKQFSSIIQTNFRLRFDLETRDRLKQLLDKNSEANAEFSLCNRATFRDLFHAQ